MKPTIRKFALAAALATAFASAAGAQTFGAPSAPLSAPGASSLDLAPKVGLEVTKLRRLADKGVLQLEFSVTNRSDQPVTLSNLGLADNFQMAGLNIVDFANKRKYDIGTANGQCLCTRFGNLDGGLVKTGETRSFWAWFALPPADVQQMAVLVADRAPLLNIPLQ